MPDVLRSWRGGLHVLALGLLLALPVGAGATERGMGTGCYGQGNGQGGYLWQVCSKGSVVYHSSGAYWVIDYYRSYYYVGSGNPNTGCHDNETSVGPSQGYRSGTGSGQYNSPDSGCPGAWISRTGYGSSTTYPGQTVFKGTFWFDVSSYPDQGRTLQTAVF